MRRTALLFAVLGTAAGALSAAPAADLLLSAGEAVEMRAELGKHPLFDAVFESARAQMEEALSVPIDVPVPADAAAYTHERHKRNYVEMHLAGILYQVTGEDRYAVFIREHLRRYADLYPAIGSHPAARRPGSGRLFWQTLNEAVWLVHASQAYCAVRDTMPAAERTRIEENLFRPMARYLSEERHEEFDRIHNHATWATTAVGMIGYAMGDETLVKKALHGSRMDGSAGWLRQLDELISPDGLYVEGPYYARYALWPFFIFAEVIERNSPFSQVFSRSGGRLAKAATAMIQQSYVNGEFLPLNDALKEKTLHSPDAILVLNIAYARCGRDPALLSVAKRQGAVTLTPAGLQVARALGANPDPPPFPYGSVEFRDGPNGERGGLGLLRSGSGRDEFLAALKYTSLGMGHGHFDKLSLAVYDQGLELLPDYGAVRFLNIEQKMGGRYLPENKSYASQTVAHNTVTVDGRSNYGGDYNAAEDAHSLRHFFNADDPDFQVVSARDGTAYPDVLMQRTVAMIRDPRLAHPVLVDIFRLVSKDEHQYDYPVHYAGRFLATNVDYKPFTDSRRPLGDGHGYEHLWVEAAGRGSQPVTTFTWLNGRRFYTVTTATPSGGQVFFTRTGANDPKFNLRPETAMILRTRAASHVFASVIEPHGFWNPTEEFTVGNFPTVRSVTVLSTTEDGTVVRVAGSEGLAWTLMISNRPTDFGAHTVRDDEGKAFTWTGPAAIIRQ